MAHGGGHGGGAARPRGRDRGVGRYDMSVQLLWKHVRGAVGTFMAHGGGCSGRGNGEEWWRCSGGCSEVWRRCGDGFHGG